MDLRLTWHGARRVWGMLAGVILGVLLFHPVAAQERPIRVLISTGDWKTQAWYQDVWMGGKKTYRGRFIRQKVNDVAPGQFEFTEIPNYIAQEYLDADYLSQFDVLLLGDIMAHLPDKFQTAVRGFVADGGGVVYCANHKWGTGILKLSGTPFEDVLPTTYPRPDEKGGIEAYLGHRDFLPKLAAPDHPVMRGLAWATCPPLGGAVNMPARPGATVLLQTPPVRLRSWQVMGPFENDFAREFGPEAGCDLNATCRVAGSDKHVGWKVLTTEVSGYANLAAAFFPNANVSAYAVTYLRSLQGRKVLVTAGSDDGIRVWVNHNLVISHDVLRGAAPGQEKAEAELKAGWNEVLVKVTQGTGGWGFYLDVVGPDGNALADLLYSTKPEETEPVVMPSKPILTAWQYGKGRAVFSASIFANDETSERFGEEWPDFGKFYAQLFRWLGENAVGRQVTLTDAPAAVAATVDFTRPLNAFPAGMFSIHGNEGINNDPDKAMKHYMALNPQGAISRGGPCATGLVAGPQDIGHREKYDFSKVDAYLAECKQYGTQPIAHCHGVQYGSPQWLWKDGRWLGNATEKDAEVIAEMVAAYVEHANKGRRDDPAYELNVRYVDIGNEPNIDDQSIGGYVNIVKAVGRRVHRDYPGVLVGAYCPYEMKYVRQFIVEVDGDFDWFSFHPYGWTSGEICKWFDEIQAFAREKGRKDLKMLITEWDFWIQGRLKFDYMVTRYFPMLERDDVLGAIHYRWWQYSEPIYLFGVMWAGWGQDNGAGEKHTPMHDAYDAFWIFRDFRGHRVESTKTLTTPEVSRNLLDHLHVAGARTGDRLDAVLYYDWAYDGSGYKDYAGGKNYPQVAVTVKMILDPSDRERSLSVSCATGEACEIVKQGVKIPPGQKELTETIQVRPLTAYSLAVQ